MRLGQLNIHMEENEAFRQSIQIHMETVKNDVQKSINFTWIIYPIEKNKVNI